MERTPEPISLQEAIEYFSNPDNCREYVVARRWANGVECPTCGCKDVIFLANQNRWQCRNKHSKRQFSLKTGTIYEDSPLGLDKWLVATWLVSNCKNGVSSCEVGRALHITQKTAWFMDQIGRFTKTPLWAWTSGWWRRGWFPIARTASAVAKSGGHSTSPRKPHGSWITASGFRWAWDLGTSSRGR